MQYITKSKAINLRKQGYSYSQIMGKVGVSKSTLSYWLSSIKYHPNTEAKLKINRARLDAILSKGKIRQLSVEEAKKYAREEMKNVNRRDLLMLGLGIYIGEGTKTHNMVRIANSNPVIIKFMVRWFKEIFGLRTENIRLRIHLYPDNNINESRKYWSSNTGIPLKYFRPIYIDVRKMKTTKKKGRTPHGTAHVSIVSYGKKEFGVILYRKICALIDEVLR